MCTSVDVTLSRQLPLNSFNFVLFFVETCRSLGQPVMKILNVLGDEAAGPGVVLPASFVGGTQQELGVGLCRRKV
jgi:hypothetical protein